MSDSAPVAVIGAGWAGMAAAVTLAARDVNVTVFEAARTPGGRARRVTLDGIDLDNGQHILIGAYRATLDMMRNVGADPSRLLRRMPLELQYADGFRLRAPRLPYPLNLAAALFGARGLGWRDACSAARFMSALQRAGFKVGTDRNAALFLAEHGQVGTIAAHLWEPLCISALNTPPQRASAQLFVNVLRDGLTGNRANSDLLVPRTDMGSLFPDPAGAFIAAHGGRLETGNAVKRIVRAPGGYRLDERPELYSRVVVAVGPQHLAALLADLPELEAERACVERFEYEPIVTCYLQYAPEVRLPTPMLGFCGGILQWVFDRGQLDGPPGLLAAVISASGAHQDLANEALAKCVHSELSSLMHLEAAPRWSRVIAERRATFSCTPGLERPQCRTPLPGLVLAGDYVASDYPATLEAAVRSGIAAGEALLTR